jgi:hypothetical protein
MNNFVSGSAVSTIKREIEKATGNAVGFYGDLSTTDPWLIFSVIISQNHLSVITGY